MNYIMDTLEEGQRIERKTDRPLTIEQLRWAGISSGLRVLDLGCASGTTSRLVAEIVGKSGIVVGVDASESRLEEGKRHTHHYSTIEYRQGYAESIPATEREFDVSWSRFLFEYLTDPATALGEMIRVTKPGGTVCVSDIDGNCIWHSPCNAYLANEVDEAIRTLGIDFHPRIGLALYSMFVDAGLQDLKVDIRAYHIIAGTIDVEQEEHWVMKLRGVEQALQKRGWCSDRTAALVHHFINHLRDPRTLTYSVLISVRGRVPQCTAKQCVSLK